MFIQLCNRLRNSYHEASERAHHHTIVVWFGLWLVLSMFRWNIGSQYSYASYASDWDVYACNVRIVNPYVGQDMEAAFDVCYNTHDIIDYSSNTQSINISSTASSFWTPEVVAGINNTMITDEFGIVHIAYSLQTASRAGVVKYYNPLSNTWQMLGGAPFSSQPTSNVILRRDAPNNDTIIFVAYTNENWEPFVSYYDAYEYAPNVSNIYTEGNESWQVLGNGPITSNAVSHLSMHTYNGIPYVLFEDTNTSDFSMYTYDYNLETWILVGPVIDNGNVADASMVISDAGRVYVTYRDDSNGGLLRVKYYDSGTDSWITPGGVDTIVAGRSDWISMVVIDGDTQDDIYVNYNNGWPKVIGFDADTNTWNTPISLSNGTMRWGYMAKNPVTQDIYVTFADGSDGRAGKVFLIDRFTNTASLVGGWNASAGGVGYSRIRFDEDGNVYLLYRDGANSNIGTIRKWDGNTWTTLYSISSNGAVTTMDLSFDSHGNAFAGFITADNVLYAHSLIPNPNPDPGYTDGDATYWFVDGDAYFKEQSNTLSTTDYPVVEWQSLQIAVMGRSVNGKTQGDYTYSPIVQAQIYTGSDEADDNTVRDGDVSTWCSSHIDDISITLDDCQGLATIYVWSNGDWWNDNSWWFDDTDICSRYGVGCGEWGEVVELYLDDNNLVGQLILQGLSTLQAISFSNNEIYYLEASGMENLYEVYWPGNLLEFAEIVDNNSLEYVTLSSNNLDNDGLIINNNIYLYYLDISNNPFLTDLPGVYLWDWLLELYIYDTNIQFLDLTNASNLYLLDASNSRLTGLYTAEAIDYDPNFSVIVDGACLSRDLLDSTAAGFLDTFAGDWESTQDDSCIPVLTPDLDLLSGSSSIFASNVNVVGNPVSGSTLQGSYALWTDTSIATVPFDSNNTYFFSSADGNYHYVIYRDIDTDMLAGQRYDIQNDTWEFMDDDWWISTTIVYSPVAIQWAYLYVVYGDQNGDIVVTYYDDVNSAWIEIETISDVGAGDGAVASITHLGHLTIAYTDEWNEDYISIKQHDIVSNTMVDLGTSSTAWFSPYLAFASDNTPYLAHNSHLGLSLEYYDGNARNTAFIISWYFANSSIIVDFTSDDHVIVGAVWYDDTTQTPATTIYMYNPDDASFLQLGDSPLVTSSDYIDIAVDSMDTIYVAHNDLDNGSVPIVQVWDGVTRSYLGDGPLDTIDSYGSTLTVHNDILYIVNIVGDWSLHILYWDESSATRQGFGWDLDYNWDIYESESIESKSISLSFDEDGEPSISYIAGDELYQGTIHLQNLYQETLINDRQTIGSVIPNISSSVISANLPSGIASLVSTDGTHYRAFVNNSQGGRLSVQAYDDESQEWLYVWDEDISVGGASFISIEESDDGTLYVSFVDRWQGGTTQLMYLENDTRVYADDNDGLGVSTSFAQMYMTQDNIYIYFRNGADGNKMYAYAYDIDDDRFTLLGDGAISSGNANDLYLRASNDWTVYAAYRDDANGGKVTVKQLIDDVWTLLWDTVTDGYGDYISMEINNDDEACVLYRKRSNGWQATVSCFDNTAGTWEPQGGETLSISTTRWLRLHTDNSGNLCAIFADGGIGWKGMLKCLIDDTWTTVWGSSFSNGGVGWPSVQFHQGIPFVSFRNGFVNNAATIASLNEDNQREVLGNTTVSTSPASEILMSIGDVANPIVHYRDDMTSSLISESFVHTTNINSSCTYQWYRNLDAISNETSIYYTIGSEDIWNTLYFEITPACNGINPGSSVRSSGMYVTTPLVTEAIDSTEVLSDIEPEFIDNSWSSNLLLGQSIVRLSVNNFTGAGAVTLHLNNDTYTATQSGDKRQSTIQVTPNVLYDMEVDYFEDEEDILADDTLYSASVPLFVNHNSSSSILDPNDEEQEDEQEEEQEENTSVSQPSGNNWGGGWGWGWGGGWSSSSRPTIQTDADRQICEIRDCSDSYYDESCGVCLEDEDEQITLDITNDDIVLIQDPENNIIQELLINDKSSFDAVVEDIASTTSGVYDTELIEAYVFAKDVGITTIDSIDEAMLMAPLRRDHAAKMLVNYALNVLRLSLDTSRDCSFADMSTSSFEMASFARMACQLGIMWLQADGITPMAAFNPDMLVDRAQFGTMLSRLLYPGQASVDADCRYCAHLKLLQEYAVMNIIDNPEMLELRWYVMLMLMRSLSSVDK